MARFVYKAIGPDGAEVDGDMEADSETAVIERLQANGLYPIEAQASAPTGRRRRGGLNADELLNFTRELATMLDAGLALDNALATLASLNTKVAARRTIEGLRAAVEAGKPLSAALEESDTPFTPFYVNLIRAGEATGTVEATLFRLTDYLERRRSLFRSVISAIAYPAVLMVVAGASLLVLLLFVVPRFEPLFADLGGALPWSTQIVVGLAELVRHYWWLLIVLVAGAPPMFRALLSDPSRRLAFDRGCLHSPVLGSLLLRIEIAQFSRTLGALLRDGVPMLNAVEIVSNAQHNQVFRALMVAVKSSLEQGHGLTRPFVECGFFPQLGLQLMQVGESTGTLPAMLMKLADIYDEEVRTAMARVLTVLEPALILCMGLAVGFIIVAILLAIVGLNDLVV